MPNDFWRQTWRENGLMAESYHNKVKLSWEQARYISTMIYNVNCQKKSQMLKPEQIFPLPIDKIRKQKRDIPKSTRQQMQAFENKSQSMTNKKTLK